MGNQPFRIAIALCAGLALGSAVTYFTAHRSARVLQAAALDRAPRGFLVLEPKAPGQVTVTLDLAGSVGRNPGDPLRYYAGSATTATAGSIGFSYPPLNSPGLGDVILVRLLTDNFATRTFYVNNGAFGVLFENPELRLTYRPARSTDPGRPN
jgi:hypothetical protein